MLDAGDWSLRVVYQLVVYGVFERHPNLKLVLTEVPGVIWNEMCLKMDSLHKTPLRQKDHALPRLPSEYAATNVWMGNSFQSRQEAVAAIEIGHEDRFLWGSDYPHPEGTFTYPDSPDDYPMTRLSLANTYHGLPLDKTRKLVGENALAAYPRARRCGAAQGRGTRGCTCRRDPARARSGPVPIHLPDRNSRVPHRGTVELTDAALVNPALSETSGIPT